MRRCKIRRRYKQLRLRPTIYNFSSTRFGNKRPSRPLSQAPLILNRTNLKKTDTILGLKLSSCNTDVFKLSIFSDKYCTKVNKNKLIIFCGSGTKGSTVETFLWLPCSLASGHSTNKKSMGRLKLEFTSTLKDSDAHVTRSNLATCVISSNEVLTSAEEPKVLCAKLYHFRFCCKTIKSFLSCPLESWLFKSKSGR